MPTLPRSLAALLPLAAAALPASARASDLDADGLDDALEALHGTDPAEPDTDGDTVPDGAEVLALGTDPTRDDADCRLGPWVDHPLSQGSPSWVYADAADLDGDGDLDALFGEPGATRWQPNRGDGTFDPPRTVAQHPPGFVAPLAADLDADGDPDVLEVDELGRTLKASPNLGGTFGPGQPLPAFPDGGPGGVNAAAAADLEPDGDLDLLVTTWRDSASPARGAVGVYEQRSPGVLVPAVIDRRASTSAALGDLDGDGDLDLAATQGPTLAWYPRVGAGFGPRQVAATARRDQLALALGDLDGDGDLDLASAGDGDVSWTENRGGGTFAPLVRLARDGAEHGSVAAADLDLDGDPDLVVSAWDGAAATWIETFGGGAFSGLRPLAPQDRSLAWSYAPGAVPADLDGDGDPDVLSQRWNGQTYDLGWWENPLPADADADGLSDAAEVCLVGSAPRLWDTDLGGVGDGAELLAVTDPLDRADDGPGADLDADGVADPWEALLGTDPALADSDGDGLSDGDEVWRDRTDPLSADTDGDGLDDGDEVLVHGSSPLGADTDGDRLDDGDEALLHGTSPASADTDGDGLDDGAELALHRSDPLVADPDPDADGLADPAEATFGTDPADPDTDGDALGDGQEADLRTDPLDPDSDGDTVPDGGEVLVLGTDPLRDGSRCQPDTWPPTRLDPGEEFRSVQAVDLDRDGDLDVLAAAGSEPGIRWYLGAGDGSFAAGATLIRATSPAGAARAADLDGDGDLDLVAVEDGPAATEEVAWYEQLGGMRFGLRRVLLGGPRSDSTDGLDPVDLDGDGDLDVLSASRVRRPGLAWAENLGGGAFAPAAPIDPDPGFRSAEAVDLDGDGDLDVLALAGNTAVWVEQLAPGGFGAPAPLSRSDGEAQTAHAADLDGDGDLDVVVSSGSWGLWGTPGWLYRHENLGGGAFGPRRDLPGALEAHAVQLDASDLDGDGDLDLLAGSSWLEGRAGGFRAHRLVLDGGFSGLASAAGDLDGDGDGDAVVGFQALDGGYGGVVVEGPLRAYRHVPRGDPDGDGLSNRVEACVTGTDPERADTDGGGAGDLDELWVPTDPRLPADD